jgi:hypothetical protein
LTQKRDLVAIVSIDLDEEKVLRRELLGEHFIDLRLGSKAAGLVREELQFTNFLAMIFCRSNALLSLISIMLCSKLHFQRFQFNSLFT